ncbi:MAG: phosphate signaling complex protein PhoU [Aestuariibacter sp.]
MDLNLSTHISGKFNQELEDLRAALLAMGGQVELQLSRTLTALRTDDKRMAEKVVHDDHKINQMEVSIDDECMRIIARRHPIASDLRLVLTVVKINTDMERIGDEVERIARMIAMHSLPASERIKSGMVDTGHQILDMLQQSLNAFVRLDVDAAREVHREDKEVDAKYKQLLVQVISEMQQREELDSGWLDVLWSLRAMERIGDRCQNICEYIIYYVEGVNLRHISPAEQK